MEDYGRSSQILSLQVGVILRNLKFLLWDQISHHFTPLNMTLEDGGERKFIAKQQ